MLNPQSPIPLYRQLADILGRKIHTGEYAPGDRIPSEHSLAQAYGIGRPTARQATDYLVRKRLLARRRGSGTYVMQPPEEIDLFSLAGTIASFEKRGIPLAPVTRRGVERITVTDDPDNPFTGSQAYFLSRLSRVDRRPVLIEDIFLDTTLFSGIERFDLAGRSLSRIAEEHFYLHPSGGRQNFRIGYLTGEKGRDLAVGPRTPILLVNRTIHFGDAKNAVYSVLYCRTDRFVFSQTIGGLTHD